MVTRLRLDLENVDPTRTLSFPQVPERGAGADAVTDHSNKRGYREVGLHEEQSIRWRGHVGTFIAEHLERDISSAWHVDNWPMGYRFWVKRRSGSNRQDFYLYGYGKKKRFSSPQEFAFHAVWLYDDQYHDTGACECTNCTNRHQGEINRIWLSETPDPERPSGRGSAGGHRQARSSITDADDLTITEPLSRYVTWIRCRRLLITGLAVSERALRRQRVVREPQMFRELELVWVSIPSLQSTKPIRPPPINIWPALIKGTETEPPARDYQVQFLGVGNTLISVRPEDILPWQYFPPNSQNIISQPPFERETGDTRLESLAHFYPIRPPSSASSGPIRMVPRTYENAVPAFAFAQLIAALISREYSLSGRLPADQQPADRTLYDSIFYGPENIWLGDLVRLKPTRAEIGRLGVNTSSWRTASRGSSSRSLFAVIQEFSKENTNVGGQNQSVARFSGFIYELAGIQDVPQAIRSLPTPPSGYNFQLISPPNSPLGEIPIKWIAGRYNPSPPSTRFLYPIFKRTVPSFSVSSIIPVLKDLSDSEDDAVSGAAKAILGAMGLTDPRENTITIQTFYQGRMAAVQAARNRARDVYWPRADRYSDDSDTTMMSRSTRRGQPL